MHGLIHSELQKFVRSKIGNDKWKEILSRVDLAERNYLISSSYPDIEVITIVAEVSKETGISGSNLLEVALEKLNIYSKQYNVDSIISIERADIGDYYFKEAAYDYIVAASSLEHVKSEPVLKKVLNSLVKGTKKAGINLICMNTNIEEIMISSGSDRKPLFEILISKDDMLAMLHEAYQDWEKLHVSDHPLELEINRDEKPVMLKADHLIFVARKP